MTQTQKLLGLTVMRSSPESSACLIAIWNYPPPKSAQTPITFFTFLLILSAALTRRLLRLCNISDNVIKFILTEPWPRQCNHYWAWWSRPASVFWLHAQTRPRRFQGNCKLQRPRRDQLTPMWDDKTTQGGEGEGEWEMDKLRNRSRTGRYLKRQKVIGKKNGYLDGDRWKDNSEGLVSAQSGYFWNHSNSLLSLSPSHTQTCSPLRLCNWMCVIPS